MTDFVETGPELDQFRESVRRFFADHSSEAEVRRLMASDTGFSAETWQLMAEQLGLPGLLIPERLGGSGASWTELAVVFEEAGRALLCGPFFSTAALATPLLLTLGTSDAEELLRHIAAGNLTVGVAIAEGEAGWTEAAVQTTARPANQPSGWALTGRKDYVLDGLGAGVLLVAARGPAGMGIFAVEGSAVDPDPMHALDETRKLCSVTLLDTPARLVSADRDAWPALQQALDLACVALANESVGGAARCLDLAVAHAKQRVAFGRPIGSFQAVKHRCANLLVHLESARSAAYCAAACAARLSEDLPLMASLAKAYCSEVAVRAADDALQVFGAIGFTWEHPVHLYLKRAKANELLFGDAVVHRSRLGDLIGV